MNFPWNVKGVPHTDLHIPSEMYSGTLKLHAKYGQISKLEDSISIGT